MSNQVELSCMPENVPVLCIPRVYSNISETRIRETFQELNLGIIERVDVISKVNEKGEKFNRVFVHYERWNDTDITRQVRQRLLNGKDIKIIYEDPWFWKVSAYRKPERKTYANPPSQSNAKPMIQIDSDDEKRPIVTHKPREEPRKPDARHNKPNNKYHNEDRREPRNQPNKKYNNTDRRDTHDNRPKSSGKYNNARDNKQIGKKETATVREDNAAEPPIEKKETTPVREDNDAEPPINMDDLRVDYGDISGPFKKKQNK